MWTFQSDPTACRGEDRGAVSLASKASPRRVPTPLSLLQYPCHQLLAKKVNFLSLTCRHALHLATSSGKSSQWPQFSDRKQETREVEALARAAAFLPARVILLLPSPNAHVYPPRSSLGDS